MASPQQLARLCAADELAPGEMRRFELDGVAPIALYNIDGTFHATADTCTHAHAHLTDGDLEGEEVVCPVHFGAFHVPSGRALCFPVSALRPRARQPHRASRAARQRLPLAAQRRERARVLRALGAAARGRLVGAGERPVSAAAASAQETAAPPPETVGEVERFLFLEARLLDAERYLEWLALLTEDVHYWVPGIENRNRKDPASPYTPGRMAYFDDGWQDLERRILRFTSETAWSENPPTRHLHVVANVEVEPAERADELLVHSVTIVHRGRYAARRPRP
jgi:ethylbenzene dioxygenase beta subunit